MFNSTYETYMQILKSTRMKAVSYIIESTRYNVGYKLDSMR